MYVEAVDALSYRQWKICEPLVCQAATTPAAKSLPGPTSNGRHG